MYFIINQTKYSILSFFPKAWVIPSKFKLGISAYFVSSLHPKSQLTLPNIIHHEEKLIIIFKGKIEYAPNFNLYVLPVTKNLSVKSEVSQEGLIAVSMAVDFSNNYSKIDLEEIAFQTMSLGSICFGATLAEKPIFSNSLTIEVPSIHRLNNYNIVNSVTLNPIDKELDQLHVTKDSINYFKEINKRIANKPEIISRVRLSSIWYLRSMTESNSTLAFLSIWLALEVLGTPMSKNSSDIKKLKSKLKSIYNISPNDPIEAIIPIGKIISVRGNIVHNGANYDLPKPFINYVRLLYIDILEMLLDMPKRSLLMNSSYRRWDIHQFLKTII